MIVLAFLLGVVAGYLSLSVLATIFYALPRTASAAMNGEATWRPTKFYVGGLMAYGGVLALVVLGIRSLDFSTASLYGFSLPMLPMLSSLSAMRGDVDARLAADVEQSDWRRLEVGVSTELTDVCPDSSGSKGGQSMGESAIDPGGPSEDYEELRYFYDQYVKDRTNPPIPFERVIKPPGASAEWWYQNGHHEYGLAYQTRSMAAHMSGAENSTIALFIRDATRLLAEPLPDSIEYRGRVYYNPGTAIDEELPIYDCLNISGDLYLAPAEVVAEMRQRKLGAYLSNARKKAIEKLIREL